MELETNTAFIICESDSEYLLRWVVSVKKLILNLFLEAIYLAFKIFINIQKGFKF